MRDESGSVRPCAGPRFGAHLHDTLEEAPRDPRTAALADPGEGGVVWHGFVEIVAYVPPQGQAVGHRHHKPPPAPQVVEEEHELKLEEGHGIDRPPAAPGVERANHLPHEREVIYSSSAR
jgi:hypothetical protein